MVTIKEYVSVSDSTVFCVSSPNVVRQFVRSGSVQWALSLHSLVAIPEIMSKQKNINH